MRLVVINHITLDGSCKGLHVRMRTFGEASPTGDGPLPMQIQ